MTFLVERPRAGRLISKTIRKFRLRRFRYNVIYAIDADEIVIVTVAHHRRHPGYWRGRIRPRR